MLRSIELRNFKAHEELAADFVEGVNFIYGPNGAGKSSLLEAIAVALYGSKWIQKVKARWADLVRRGAAEASIQLAFVGIDGVEYVVARRFGQSGSISSGTYLLADGKPAARGDQDVTAAVAKALGLGVEEFANLAYIRQGELRRILAEPDYIDRLFRLDEFDWLEVRRPPPLKARLAVISRPQYFALEASQPRLGLCFAVPARLTPSLAPLTPQTACSPQAYLSSST